MSEEVEPNNILALLDIANELSAQILQREPKFSLYVRNSGLHCYSENLVSAMRTRLDRHNRSN